MTEIAEEEITAECKAEGCQRIPEKESTGRRREFCDRHWKRVPRIVRELLLQEYRPGQGQNRLAPSLDYTVAIRLAITCIIFHKNHGRAAPRSAIIETQKRLAAEMTVEVRQLMAERAARQAENEAANVQLPSPSESPEITPTKEKENDHS